MRRARSGKDATELSIIIVSYNTRELLDRCLSSVYEQTKGAAPFEVIVVDNHSSDDSPAMVLAKYPAARLIENNDNVGFGRANNQGAEASTARFLMLLNSDALLREDTASALIAFLNDHPDVGAVGPNVRLLDGSRQPKTFGNLPTPRALLAQNLLLCRVFPHSRMLSGIFIESACDRPTQVGWISGVCMVMPRAAYLAVGGFDPAFFMYAEDMDLCRRLRKAGWKIFRMEDHAIEHLCGGSSKTEEQILRNGVMQQRNFLKLLDASTGVLGRIFARGILTAGLLLRLALRGIARIGNGQQARLAFRSSMLCLRDLFGNNALSEKT